MKVSLNRMSDFVLPVFWGGQGLILCLTNSNIFFVVGAILVLLSIFKYLIKSQCYNIVYLVCVAFYFIISGIYLFLLFLMFSSCLCLCGIILNLIVVVYMLRKYGAN